MSLFWLFRRRKPLPSAQFYLDCAASIMVARGKATNLQEDRAGRVDVLGAIRLAVWGTNDTYEMFRLIQKRSGEQKWERHCQAKSLLANRLLAIRPQFGSLSRYKDGEAAIINIWNDESDIETVVTVLRKIAKGER